MPHIFLSVWVMNYWVADWGMFECLGLSRPLEIRYFGPRNIIGLRVRPIKGIGPSLANWAISGSMVGLGSLPSVGL